MVYGSFFIQLSEDAKVEKKIVFSTPDSPPLAVNDSELLRVRMGHADKKYVITILPDYQFYTYKVEVKEKRAMLPCFGGLILEKDENSGTYSESLRVFTEKMAEQRLKSQEELNEQIAEFHKQYFNKPQMILDRKELEKRLSDKVKELNKQGKFDAANALLDKIKKIPGKLYAAQGDGETEFRRQQYEKAEKEFENAKKYAEELGEKDLVKYFTEKIQLTKRVPTLTKKRDEAVDKAMEGLRSDNFAMAQKFFKIASDTSEELLDSRHAEEYALKAKALAEYVKVDAKFR
jgi:hypothetical protein